MNSFDAYGMKRDGKHRQAKEKRVAKIKLQHKHITEKSRVSVCIQRKNWVKGHFRWRVDISPEKLQPF